MARIKEVLIYDQHFRIASLTLTQVEELFPSSTEEMERVKALPASEHYQRAYMTMCYGLNNALPKDTPEADRWDKKKINDNLDMLTFTSLHEAILEHSGLTVAKGDKEKDEGEKTAAVVM